MPIIGRLIPRIHSVTRVRLPLIQAFLCGPSIKETSWKQAVVSSDVLNASVKEPLKELIMLVMGRA